MENYMLKSPHTKYLLIAEYLNYVARIKNRIH